MRIHIYGCSRLTNALAPVLVEDGHQVTVLDVDADRLEVLSRQTRIKFLCTAEPLMQDYLLDSGIAQSQVFYALSDDDHLNLLLCQVASHIYNVANVMCRVEDPKLQGIYSQLGVNLLDNGPDFLSAARDSLGAR